MYLWDANVVVTRNQTDFVDLLPKAQLAEDCA